MCPFLIPSWDWSLLVSAGGLSDVIFYESDFPKFQIIIYVNI